MSPEVTIMTLAGVAATIGFLHTLLGPDHYIPFIVMSRARGWSIPKTCWITLLCGLGHVGSSIVLGLVGVGIGIAVGELTSIESVRGDIAAYLFIAFGLAYFVWGLRRAIRNKPHTHIHLHPSDGDHAHKHSHVGAHSHVHDGEAKANITPWVLFTIFVFGPCEPLIPILMYPAATKSYWGLALVTAIFAAVTITTMLAVVLLGTLGISFIPFKKVERYSHALAGATIALCGVLIVLGL
jgi:nickel/cobalt transporter (NicO) family protein